ncbi:MAG: ATP-binding protein [Planctomycetes bacterium]|nr:ATP-binding protein [Planctomycetota bacterium]
MLPRSKALRRLRCSADLLVSLEDGRSFNGIVRDVSTTGLCGFLSSSDLDITPPGARMQVTASGAEGSIGPIEAETVASEPSFLSGYDLVFMCKFRSLKDRDRESVEKFIKDNRLDPASERPAEMESEPLALPDIQNADVVQFTFPARFAYVAHFRDACEKLAEEAGFEEFDCHMIKIVADEIFSNALHHGSDSYGASRIHARVLVGPDAVALCVRDHCGRPFDYQKYRKTPEEGEAPAQGSGLNLVHRIVDDWTVKIEPGKFTEVCALKRKAHHPTHTR